MTQTETTLPIVQNGKYNNITVETKYEWDKAKKVFKFGADNKKIVKAQGLRPGEFIIVEKKFPDATEREGQYGKYYTVLVNYLGSDVGFFLNERYVNTWNNLGGVGDKIKISCVTEMQLNRKAGVEVPVDFLKFEKV